MQKLVASYVRLAGADWFLTSCALPAIVCMEEEDVHRRDLWERNLMLITMHNLEYSMGLHTYDLSMNHMGDLVRRSPSPMAY